MIQTNFEIYDVKGAPMYSTISSLNLESIMLSFSSSYLYLTEYLKLNSTRTKSAAAHMLTPRVGLTIPTLHLGIFAS